MKLDEYLKANKISNRDFAKKIGVHEFSIPRYRREKSIPSLQTLVKIREATSGQVDAEDFIQTSQLESK